MTPAVFSGTGRVREAQSRRHAALTRYQSVTPGNRGCSSSERERHEEGEKNVVSIFRVGRDHGRYETFYEQPAWIAQEAARARDVANIQRRGCGSTIAATSTEETLPHPAYTSVLETVRKRRRAACGIKRRGSRSISVT
jgi:hypothetical protein